MGFLDDIPGINEGGRGRPKKAMPSGTTGVTGDAGGVVYWRVIRCPYCNCLICPVTSTQPQEGHMQIRYHKCSKCEKNFKSIEEK